MFSTKVFCLIILCQTVLANYTLNDFLEIAKPIYINIDALNTNDEISEDGKIYINSAECGKRGSHILEKIVGGTNAIKGEFPWQISLQLRTGLSVRHICGGVVIDKEWILTAAHCVNDIGASALTVVAGDHNLYIREGSEQRRTVSKIFTVGFDVQTFAYDIALLKLEKPLKFSGNHMVSPVCLPKLNEEFTGTAIISGWGRLHEEGDSPHILQKVTLPLVDRWQCKESYKDSAFYQLFGKCQICAAAAGGGKDACQGDSGGPLVCKKNDQYYLCGVVSWGIGCGRPQYPGVYTEVACYVDWIQETINNN